ncbi:thiamine-phosphate kinase [Paenibacillus harenae]|uniref:thiamine-phosphate kinase n=1 Tax=Paenibacillus harenae TaxID=306543 RepID=UPI0027D7D888|nr:thiamine-phosphate kinase [Paenibacillus harenae]
MDEFASIHHWTGERQSAEWQQRRGVVFGIGDDTAIVDVGLAEEGVAAPKRMLLAVDTMVETVHFNDATMREEDIGYKALAANVSDISAMGGVPLHALVSVSVPRAWGPERMRRLYDGLYACAERYGVAVIGGDTTSSPEHLVIAVTVTGTVEAALALRRSGAMPGDAVFVTGAVGMAAAGLHALLAQRVDGAAEAAHPVIVQAHRRPAPSVRAGRLLAAHGLGCHALNDVSDGLASEAWEIAEASGVRVVLHETELPRSGSMAAYASEAGMDPLEWMLYGGEDYALLGTIDKTSVIAALELFRKEGIPFFLIGEIEAGDAAVELVRARAAGVSHSGKQEKRVQLAKRGYNHFKR